MTRSCILDPIHWIGIELTREWLRGLQSDTAHWLPWSRSDDASLFLDGLQTLWFKESLHVELKRWRFAAFFGCTVVTVMHRSRCWINSLSRYWSQARMTGWFAVGYNSLSDCVECRGIEARTLRSCFQMDRSRGDSRTSSFRIAVVPLHLGVWFQPDFARVRL